MPVDSIFVFCLGGGLPATGLFIILCGTSSPLPPPTPNLKDILHSFTSSILPAASLTSSSVSLNCSSALYPTLPRTLDQKPTPPSRWMVSAEIKTSTQQTLPPLFGWQKWLALKSLSAGEKQAACNTWRDYQLVNIPRLSPIVFLLLFGKSRVGGGENIRGTWDRWRCQHENGGLLQRVSMERDCSSLISFWETLRIR